MYNNIKKILNFNFMDFAKEYQIKFQDPATPLMEGIIDLHHYIFFFLIVIFILTVFLLLRILNYYVFLPIYMHSFPINTIIPIIKYPIFLNVLFRMTQIFRRSEKFTHNTILEIVWTILPSFILILIAIPSFVLLYSIDEVINPEWTLKVIGHQWYWSYEQSDYFYNKLFLSSKVSQEFDSFMLPEDELFLKELRLLEVDNVIIVPINTHIRVIVTAADVLHAWAVPSLGVKIDAVPGRLNQTTMYIKRPGIFYGQCSEICGVNHGFMPISIYAIQGFILKNILK